jgi:hypothetical protein
MLLFHPPNQPDCCAVTVWKALDFQRHVVRAYANEEGTKNAISNSLIKRGFDEDE